MKHFIKILIPMVVFSFCLFGQAAPEIFEGFVPVSARAEVYVKWHQAVSGKPTVILINGLTYSTVEWNRFAAALTNYGIGVIQYDMQGMGQTLLKYAPITTEISYQTQVQNLKALITKFKIKSKVNLVGLSYGGGIALAFSETYPQLVQNTIVMAPFTAPLAAQDSWIRLQVATTRFMYPYNPYTDEEIYDYFLKVYIYSTFPIAEPALLDNPYKLEATFRLAQGIRNFYASVLANKLPPHSVHLVIAGRDELVDRASLESFWSAVPAAAQGSKMVIVQSKHKIPENYPDYSAAWVAEILTGRSRLKSDKIFEGNPVTGIVRADSGYEFNIDQRQPDEH